jgi:hypothetical protein
VQGSAGNDGMSGGICYSISRHFELAQLELIVQGELNATRSGCAYRLPKGRRGIPVWPERRIEERNVLMVEQIEALGNDAQMSGRNRNHLLHSKVQINDRRSGQ